MHDRHFTPALGRFQQSAQYDRLIALLTREQLWRRDIARRLNPQPDDVIVDVGCGTGTLALMLKNAAPAACVIGVDPDENILAIARAKAQRAGVNAAFTASMGDDVAARIGENFATKAVSTLVLHQCPIAMKCALLENLFRVLRPGGQLVIGDYAWQRTAMMRLGFRLIVQMADGKADTQPNADGILPALIANAGFIDIAEARVIPTVSGSISIYTAIRPEQVLHGGGRNPEHRLHVAREMRLVGKPSRLRRLDQ